MAIRPAGSYGATRIHGSIWIGRPRQGTNHGFHRLGFICNRRCHGRSGISMLLQHQASTVGHAIHFPRRCVGKNSRSGASSLCRQVRFFHRIPCLRGFYILWRIFRALITAIDQSTPSTAACASNPARAGEAAIGQTGGSGSSGRSRCARSQPSFSFSASLPIASIIVS
ncbi:MAG: hypothetical protein QOH32_1299 [Bradyrhizobium sp.]|nr:hypothetical protein [Bradyrhizobium sp.]